MQISELQFKMSIFGPVDGEHIKWQEFKLLTKNEPLKEPESLHYTSSLWKRKKKYQNWLVTHGFMSFLI